MERGGGGESCSAGVSVPGMSAMFCGDETTVYSSESVYLVIWGRVLADLADLPWIRSHYNLRNARTKSLLFVFDILFVQFIAYLFMNKCINDRHLHHRLEGLELYTFQWSA